MFQGETVRLAMALGTRPIAENARKFGIMDNMPRELAMALGAGEILLTSMDGDGTQAGYALELTRAVADAVSVPVIASGGAGSIDHIAQALDPGPKGGHASAALLASLLHDGVLTLEQIKRELIARQLPIRPLAGPPTLPC